MLVCIHSNVQASEVKGAPMGLDSTKALMQVLAQARYTIRPFIKVLLSTKSVLNEHFFYLYL